MDKYSSRDILSPRHVLHTMVNPSAADGTLSGAVRRQDTLQNRIENTPIDRIPVADVCGCSGQRTHLLDFQALAG